MKIGVLAVQGAVSEHVNILKKAVDEMGLQGSVSPVRFPDEIEQLDGLVIPGGESSTISRLLDAMNIRDLIIEKAEGGMQLMGTCAGSILLAKEGDEAVDRSDTELLGLMDMSVKRNAFGRQKFSFEHRLDIERIADDFHAVFIRAPAIDECWKRCEPLSHVKDTIVAAEQDNLLALSFHPELTDDIRVHKYFLEKIFG